MRKKAVSLFMVVCMIVSLVPSIHAAEIVDSGNCGDNVTWTLDDNGTLTISDNGYMDNYDYPRKIPWYSSRESVKNAVINGEVTNIGSSAFYGCASLTKKIIGRIKKQRYTMRR